jgi:hypothetical protein
MSNVFALVFWLTLPAGQLPGELVIMDAYDSMQACATERAEAVRENLKDETTGSRTQCVAMPSYSPCLRAAARLTHCPTGCGGIAVLKTGDPNWSQWYFACRHLLTH